VYWGNCDNLILKRFTEAQTEPSQEKMVGPISEEHTGGAKYIGQCPPDYVVTAIKCEKDECDELTLRCNKLIYPGKWKGSGTLEERIQQGFGSETREFSEEETGDVGKFMNCTKQSALVGIKCYDSRCDNKQMICMEIADMTWYKSEAEIRRCGGWTECPSYAPHPGTFNYSAYCYQSVVYTHYVFLGVEFNIPSFSGQSCRPDPKSAPSLAEMFHADGYYDNTVVCRYRDCMRVGGGEVKCCV